MSTPGLLTGNWDGEEREEAGYSPAGGSSGAPPPKCENHHTVFRISSIPESFKTHLETHVWIQNLYNSNVKVFALKTAVSINDTLLCLQTGVEQQFMKKDHKEDMGGFEGGKEKREMRELC